MQGGRDQVEVEIDRPNARIRKGTHRHRPAVLVGVFCSCLSSLRHSVCSFPTPRALSLDLGHDLARASVEHTGRRGGPCDRLARACLRAIAHNGQRASTMSGTHWRDSIGSTPEGRTNRQGHHKRVLPYDTTVRLANKGVKNWLKTLENNWNKFCALCLLNLPSSLKLIKFALNLGFLQF